MKKTLIVALALFCASAVIVSAQDAPKKHKLTAEQKEVQAAMVAKYDTNKDGKLDKDERAKISAEDKAKMVKAGLIGHKKKTAAATTAPAAPAEPTAPAAPAAPAPEAGK